MTTHASRFTIHALIISSIEVIAGSSISKLSGLPRITVAIRTSNNDTPSLIVVVPDTGAQVTVASLDHMRLLNITAEQLHPPQCHLKNACGTSINVVGSYSVLIEHNQNIIEEEIYFASGVCDLFLSLTACKNIGLIPRNFPHVIAHNHCIPNTDCISNTGLSNDDMVLPSGPDTLPYPPTEEHILELEAWLLQKFSTTTFNISSDKLPRLSGKLS